MFTFDQPNECVVQVKCVCLSGFYVQVLEVPMDGALVQEKKYSSG